MSSNRRLIVWSLLGAAGLSTFILLAGRVVPYRAANIRISRSQAIRVACDFLESQGADWRRFRLSTAMEYDQTAFAYLQKRYGFRAAETMVRFKKSSGFDFQWVVIFFQNRPRSAPGEEYRVRISGPGIISGYSHTVSPERPWPRKDRARLEEEDAFRIAEEWLDRQNIDRHVTQGLSTALRTWERRIDHMFVWKDVSAFDSSTVELSVTVQGDEVGDFGIMFHPPEKEATSIKRQAGIDWVIQTVVTASMFFLVGFLVFVVFVRRYHEGEVEVRRAKIVFGILWSSFVLLSCLKFRLNAWNLNFGELSPDGVALGLFILFVWIIWPFVSVLGFASWGVGESFGREKAGERFTAIDALMNRKWFTLSYARSAWIGYCAGFIVLGLTVSLFWIVLHGFGGVTFLEVFSGVLAVPLPFLIPVLHGISAGLFSELLFRLFGNLYLFSKLKSKILATAVVSVFWAFFALYLWGFSLSIRPLMFEGLIWFGIGLFLGFVFWKVDLMAAVMANFTAIGVIHALPMLTSSSPSVHRQGLVSILFLAIPAIPMVGGFFRRQTFEMRWNRIPDHVRRIAERVRLSKELEIAGRVQSKLLPKSNPRVAGFDISGFCVPATEMGGDYFDYMPLGDSRIGVVIGDVSGKGIPAAIYMTLTKGIVQSNVGTVGSTRQVLVKVNDLLYRMMERGSFVSLLYAVLDASSKAVTFSSAGHNPALFIHGKSGRAEWYKPDGLALGLEQGRVFERVIQDKRILMEPGDLLVLYTDGLVEAMNSRQEEFGEERLAKVMGKSRSLPVPDLLEDIRKEVRSFVKESPQHDDMTMVIIRRRVDS